MLMSEEIQDLIKAVNDLRQEVSQLREMVMMLVDLVVQADIDDDEHLERLKGFDIPEWSPERGFGM